MKDYLIFLYKYFAQFVPDEALGDGALSSGSDFVSDIISRPTDRVLPISTFVVSANTDFVSDRISTNEGYVLFVEYGTGEYGGQYDSDYVGNVAITVARPYTMSTNNNITEITGHNATLDILFQLLDYIKSDAEQGIPCVSSEMFDFPVKVNPVNPAAFFKHSGFSAFFNNVEV